VARLPYHATSICALKSSPLGVYPVRRGKSICVRRSFLPGDYQVYQSTSTSTSVRRSFLQVHAGPETITAVRLRRCPPTHRLEAIMDVHRGPETIVAAARLSPAT